MLKYIILLLSSLLIANCSSTYQTTNQSVPISYQKPNNLSKGLAYIIKSQREISGWLTTYNYKKPHDDSFGISAYAYQKDLILVFTQFKTNASNVRENKTLDYLVLHYSKTLPKNYMPITQVGCGFNNKDDDEIFALVTDTSEDNKERFTKLDKAWRANHLTGKIEEISTQGLSCANEGYGAE